MNIEIYCFCSHNRNLPERKKFSRGETDYSRQVPGRLNITG